MSAASQQLDRNLIRERVFGVASALLTELGNAGSAEHLRADAHLERDLSLGSLERVELLLRLGAAFNARLPDAVIARADTLEDLVTAVAESLQGNAAGGAPAVPSSARHTAEVLSPRTGSANGQLAEGVPMAETLLDVLRHRARTDAARPHLFSMTAIRSVIQSPLAVFMKKLPPSLMRSPAAASPLAIESR